MNEIVECFNPHILKYSSKFSLTALPLRDPVGIRVAGSLAKMADEAVEDCDPMPESSLADVRRLLYLVSMSKTSEMDFRLLVLFFATARFMVRLLTSDETLTGRLMFMWTRINPSNV